MFCSLSVSCMPGIVAWLWSVWYLVSDSSSIVINGEDGHLFLGFGVVEAACMVVMALLEEGVVSGLFQSPQRSCLLINVWKESQKWQQRQNRTWPPSVRAWMVGGGFYLQTWRYQTGFRSSETSSDVTSSGGVWESVPGEGRSGHPEYEGCHVAWRKSAPDRTGSSSVASDTTGCVQQCTLPENTRTDSEGSNTRILLMDCKGSDTWTLLGTGVCIGHVSCSYLWRDVLTNYTSNMSEWSRMLQLEFWWWSTAEIGFSNLQKIISNSLIICKVFNFRDVADLKGLIVAVSQSSGLRLQVYLWFL